jgi:hypothetical protein
MAAHPTPIAYAHGKNLAVQGKRLVEALQKLKQNIGDEADQSLKKQIAATEANLVSALKNFDTIMSKMRAKPTSSQ